MKKEDAEKLAETYQQALKDEPLPPGCTWWIEPLKDGDNYGVSIGFKVDFEGKKYGMWLRAENLVSVEAWTQKMIKIIWFAAADMLERLQRLPH